MFYLRYQLSTKIKSQCDLEQYSVNFDNLSFILHPAGFEASHSNLTPNHKKMNQELNSVSTDFVSMDYAAKQMANTRNMPIGRDNQQNVQQILDSNSESSGEYEEYDEEEFEDGESVSEEPEQGPDCYQDTYFGCTKRLVVNCMIGLVYSSFKFGILRNDT